MKFVDLSVVINEKTPVYPGDPAVRIKPVGDLDKDGFTDHLLSFGSHVGTHVDAPSHLFAGGRNLDELPLKQFAGHGVYIRVDNKFDLEKIQKIPIAKNDIVLFHTGVSDKMHRPDYYKNYPEITEEVAHYLVKKKVRMVGVDMGSVDHDLSVHKILLMNEILIIENLNNLAPLVGKNFNVYAFPLRLQIDGSPARVVAEIL